MDLFIHWGFLLFLISQAANGGVVMVSFYNVFLTCNETATISDVIGKFSSFLIYPVAPLCQGLNNLLLSSSQICPCSHQFIIKLSFS